MQNYFLVLSYACGEWFAKYSEHPYGCSGLICNTLSDAILYAQLPVTEGSHNVISEIKSGKFTVCCIRNSNVQFGVGFVLGATSTAAIKKAADKIKPKTTEEMIDGLLLQGYHLKFDKGDRGYTLYTSPIAEHIKSVWSELNGN